MYTLSTLSFSNEIALAFTEELIRAERERMNFINTSFLSPHHRRTSTLRFQNNCSAPSVDFRKRVASIIALICLTDNICRAMYLSDLRMIDI